MEQAPKVLINPDTNIFFLPHGGLDNPRINIPEDTETIVFEVFDNDTTWDNFTKLPKNIKTLYLNHDGVIYEGKEGSIKKALRYLTKLEEIHICGYYSDFTLKGPISELNRDIKIIEIY